MKSNFNVNYEPHRWVVLSLPEGRYKIFGSWNGSYLEGSYWRLNSGIKEVHEDDDHYYFIGFSGSCYKCSKKGYGIMDSYGLATLRHIIDSGDGLISLMEDNNDWLALEIVA